MSPTEQLDNDWTDELTTLRRRVSQLEDMVRPTDRPRGNGDEQFRAVADSSPMLLWSAGADALMTFCNKAWLEFRGRTLGQEIGNGWTTGLHSDDLDSTLQSYLMAFYGRSPFRLECRLRRHDGVHRWMEIVAIPQFEADGTFSGYFGYARDVHDEKTSGAAPDETAAKAIASLTGRERQLLLLIVDGQSTKAAAAAMGISYKTADSHRTRILSKLGLHETASLVRFAIRAGLVNA